MDSLNYLDVFVKGLTFGATLIMGVLMISYIVVGHKSRWQKYLLGVTSTTMIMHSLTLVYRAIVDVYGQGENPYFTTGAIMLDLMCIAPLLILEVMLTRHTVMSWRGMSLVYLPFVLMITLHFITGLAVIKTLSLAITIVASLCWAVMTSYDMRRYNEMLRQTYADFEGRELRWLVRILVLLVVALLIWFVSTLIGTPLAKTIYRVAIVSIWCALVRRVLIQKETKELGEIAGFKSNMFSSSASVTSSTTKPDPKVFLIGKKFEELMHEKRLFTQFDINSVQIAAELNCSKSLLSQYFASKGTSFHSYINDMRLDYAAEQLLTTNTAVIEIAHISGYRFDNVFFRSFLEKFGCNPHEYRNKFAMAN